MLNMCTLTQVTWQQLTEATPSGNAEQAGALLSAAAVVTSQRLLIVGPDLTVLASTPQRCSGAFITSALWVGPALLYCDSGNAVRDPSSNHAMLCCCVAAVICSTDSYASQQR